VAVSEYISDMKVLSSKSRGIGIHRGFSMVEVLVSVLILAFGILSMGGLQLASLRSNQNSGKGAIAATLAKDYSEMMRSNQTVSNNTSTVANVNPYLFDTSLGSSFTATPVVDCTTTVCTPAQIATMHVADWAQRVVAQLPSGRAVVCRDSNPKNSNGSNKWACDNSGSLVTVKLGWEAKLDTREKGTTSFVISNPQLVMIGMTGFAE
jgi:type IV pilus assembly protein PilV